MPSNHNKKGLKWYKEAAKWIYSQFASDYCTVSFNGSYGGHAISTLRAYSEGTQNTSQYAKRVSEITTNSKNQQETLSNISYENIQVMPKFLDIMMSKMKERQYTVQTVANDQGSRVERDRVIGIEKMLRSPQAQAFAQQTGIAPREKSKYPKLTSAEDFEIFEEMGGVKLAREIMMKDCVDATAFNSNSAVIDEMVDRDIIVLNLAATDVFIDRNSGQVKEKYIDPARLVMSNSIYTDCRDVWYAGYIETKTIAQIRQESGDEVNEQLIYNIVKSYKGAGRKAFNQFGGSKEARAFRNGDGTYKYDGLRVDVLKCYIIASDTEARMIHKDASPDMPSPNIQNVYRIHYVCGTDYVYDCGIDEGVVRVGQDGHKEAQLGMQIYKGEGPSMVARCKGHIDDMMIAVLKKRNFLRRLPPGPRMFVDKSLLNGTVSMGGKVYTHVEMLDRFAETGLYVYESIADWGSELEGSLRAPISFPNFDFYSDVRAYIEEISHQLDLIRQATGINPIADGTTQNHDMLKGVQEGLMSASNSALNKLFAARFDRKQRNIRYIARKWQTAALRGDIKIDYLPLNSSIRKMFTLTKDIFGYEFGIQLNLAMGTMERQQFMASMAQNKQSNKLNEADYLVVMQIFNQGDYKKASVYMANAIKKREEQLHQQAIEVQQATAKANQESAVVAAQEERTTAQVKFDFDAERLKIEHQNALALEKLKGENKLKEIREKERLGSGRDVTNRVVDASLQPSETTAQPSPQVAESNE